MNQGPCWVCVSLGRDASSGLIVSSGWRVVARARAAAPIVRVATRIGEVIFTAASCSWRGLTLILAFGDRRGNPARRIASVRRSIWEARRMLGTGNATVLSSYSSVWRAQPACGRALGVAAAPRISRYRSARSVNRVHPGGTGR